MQHTLQGPPDVYLDIRTYAPQTVMGVAKWFIGSYMSKLSDMLRKTSHQIYVAITSRPYVHFSQERMIQEMERAIVKREQIAVRFKVKSEASAERSTKAKGGFLDGGNLTPVSAGGGRGGGFSGLTSATLKKRVRHFCDSYFWHPEIILDTRLFESKTLDVKVANIATCLRSPLMFLAR